MSHIQGSDYVGSMVVRGGRAPEEVGVPPLQDQGRPGQRRLRGDGAGAHPPAHRLPRRAPPARHRDGREVLLPAAAAARRRRQGPAVGGGAGARGARAGRRDPGGRRWPSGSRRSTCPGEADPIRLPRQSEALYLLQRIRDEAHRFAITFHRELRGKRMTTSVLDGIPRARRGAQEAAGQGARRRQGREGRQPRGPRRRSRGSRTRSRQAVHDKIHGPSARALSSERRAVGQTPAHTSSPIAADE